MSEVARPHREITLITKSESPRVDTWSTVERLSRILSIAAIPVVLAVGGWFIQRQLQDQTVSRDYVQLAITILEEPNKEKVAPELRQYAVNLLQKNSPIAISNELLQSLAYGNSSIPPPKTAPASTDTEQTKKGTVIVYYSSQGNVDALVRALSDEGYAVAAGPPPGQGPSSPDVRYYHPEDKDNAQEVIGTITGTLNVTPALNSSRLSDPNAVRNHSRGTIEVWLK